MSSSASRGGAERTVHQDFIARIRYSNTLPPPPNPPKLLEIPNTGLGSGYYTSSAFATRLAREQALNIEVDAELGMPLDLIGMPGVFDGDDSSIQSDPHPPAVHPHDRALLKPLSSLGKPRPTEAAVSFLRRTEYISSVGAKSGSGANPFLTAPKARRPEKRASPEPDAGTPAFVKRKIEQSFVAAQNASRDHYSRVRHPSKKNLRLAAAYPLLPDLGAFPDSGAYVTIKFSHNPVVAGTGVYDTRVLSGVFRPVDQTEEQRAAFEAASKAYERDPRRNPRPHNQSHYEYYLPEKKPTGENFRRTFTKPDGEDDDDDEKFSFTRVRAYESIEEKELSHTTKYANEVLLAFTENAAEAAPDLGGPVAGGPRAALYYPVMLRSVLRSQRQKQTARDLDDENGDGTDRPVDRLVISVQTPSEDMREHIARFRSDPLQLQEVDEVEEQEVRSRSNGQRRNNRVDSDDEDEVVEQRRHSDDEDEVDRQNGRRADSSSPAPRRSNGSKRYHSEDDEEDDAEGEEDE
ncbi:rna polymerase ii- paf1 [Ophiostoma piceae UAMH 11346]|uniref:Rna polymerase ii-paf1 n=1 Tax=Ophiostoma piceae (strain UAMH 11346) TaxID=1262450 RepID=S3D9I2_OPHP1|nr:rna polymerase ii- paf1 [Ophiostoma piceae UAMH 11346]